MVTYEESLSFLSSELIRSGYTTNGSSFYRAVGGSVVIVSVPKVDSQNVVGFCDALVSGLAEFASTHNSRSTAFIYIIPDEYGLFIKGTEALFLLSRAYSRASSAGAVVEFHVVDLISGKINSIGGSGAIDRGISRTVAELGKRVESGHDFSTVYTEPSGTSRGVRSTLRYFGTSNMIVIYVLMGINILVFIAGYVCDMIFGNDLIYLMGVQHNASVLQGEYWRLFTAMFLHADLYHLAGNMLSLLYLGMVVSRYFSKIEVLAIYFSSGIVGNLLSLWFLPKDLLSLGASGAVMGLGGVLIYMLIFSRNKREFRSTGNFFSLAIMVFFNLIYGVIRTGSNINNFAHFGGFAAGFLAALLIEKIIAKKDRESALDG